jgi:ribosome-associated protein
VNWENLRPELRWAIEAAQDKKAQNVSVLDLSQLSAFAQYFVLCSTGSGPQLEAVSDAIEERLRQHGTKPEHREGRRGAEWVLLDYGRFVIHIFSERARLYYDLERLWRAAPRLDIPAPGESPERNRPAGGAPPTSGNGADSDTTRP